MIASSFSPLSSLAGGALIGVAAAVLMLADGKVAGVSGVLARALTPVRGDSAWRVAFLAGLPLGALLVSWVTGELHGFAITASWPLLVAGGLLVGFGTALGGGCTSGHGVCGLARGSRRSLVATLAFMASGALTVFLARHVFGAG
ncbi:MAG: YeeE/YedE family protein [Myxococcota bacterium]